MGKARRPAAIAMALALALQLGTVVPAAAAGINSTAGYENGNSPLNLNLIARYASGQYNVDGGVMEIVAYSQSNGYAYAINGQSGLLAAIPLGDLTAGISVARLSGTDIDVKALVEAADSSFRYGDMTSVAISPDNTILAAALQAEGYHDAGRVALFACNADGSLTLRGLVETGVQPDMVTFTGSSTVLTADEGEPREGYGDGIVDPRGSVTVADVSTLTSEVVGFDAFDARRDELASAGIVLKKGVDPSTDLEPEYIAVSGGKAYVTLQENNAIAVLDLASRTFDGIYSAGFETTASPPLISTRRMTPMRQDLRQPHGHPDARRHRRLPGGRQNLSGHRQRGRRPRVGRRGSGHLLPQRGRAGLRRGGRDLPPGPSQRRIPASPARWSFQERGF